MKYDFHCIHNSGAGRYDNCDVCVMSDGIEIATVTVRVDESVNYSVNYPRPELQDYHHPALLIGKVACWMYRMLSEGAVDA